MIKQLMRCILLTILCLAITSCTKQEEKLQTPQEPAAVKIEHTGCKNIYPSPDEKHDICIKTVGDEVYFTVEFYLNCTDKIFSEDTSYAWYDSSYSFAVKWLNSTQVLLQGTDIYNINTKAIRTISIFAENEYVTGVYINEVEQEILFLLYKQEYIQKIVKYSVDDEKTEILAEIALEDFGFPFMDIWSNNIVQVDALIYFEIALESPSIYVLDVNTKEYKLYLADHRLIGLKDGELVVKEDDNWWDEATE